jgi:diguanylate cyclase (GGDEF)-like protein/PAS domain S-box-containing protein
VALAYGLLLYLASRDGWGTPLGGLILAAALLTALVSARQVLSARENASLRARQAIRETEARCASLIRHSSDAVLGLGEDLKVRFASPASERVLGVAPEALCGRPLLDLVHPDDRPRAGRFLADALRQAGVSPAVEWRLGGEGVGWRCIESVVSNRLADPAVRGLVLNSRDVGERRRLEDRLEQAIFHDPLTGLANRTLFRVRVEHALVRAAESGAEVAVLLLDLDDFKTVNDGLGQGQGDELLRIVAVRLLHCARGSDTAARLGGDELGLLLEDPLPLPELLQLAAAVVARMGEPVALDDHEVLVGASVGIARGGAGADADRLLRQAELAMYSAKAAGKGRFALYEPGMRTAAAERIDLEMDLRNALERGEIGLHYQPIVHLPTGAFVGAEALARWHHPRRGLVQPQAFIPLAEGRSELIVALGRLVLREACRQGAAWQARMPPGSPLHLGVNVSVRQLLHSDLVEDVASALAESGLEPRALVLEITEGTLMQGAEPILRQLRELKSIGVRLAIDDFGTGYSSLSYLHRFPIDILKIDKAFLDCMGQGLGDTRLAGAIAALAQAFGMTAVAEGVEWAAQAEAVERLGCVLAQGFHFSRPVPAEVIESEWIAPLGVGVRSCILPPESRKGSSSPECPPNKGI